MASTISSPALLGHQRPSFCHIPPAASSLGQEAVELARMAGLVLDPWQEFVLRNALGRRDDQLWSAFEVGVEVSRQNGKGGIIEARSLVGLFLLLERLLIHSAHQFDTSLEAFRRLLDLIDGRDEFSRRVKRVSRAHGEEGIELLSGQRIRFRTRTKGGGRGFTADCLFLDEGMILPTASHGALLPTLSARPNPQVWYLGSAVDQEIHEHGLVFSRIRHRGRNADPRLAWFEWSAGESLRDVEPTDTEAWARANPGLGIRISAEHIANEQRSMDAKTFGVERLGIGDWPEPYPDDESSELDLERWLAAVDRLSSFGSTPSFAFDATPDLRAAAIGVAARRADGKWHVQAVDHRPGTKWLAERLKELHGEYPGSTFACAGRSPAEALLPGIGLEVEVLDTRKHAEGCTMLVDALGNDDLRHLGTPELEAAVRGAKKRPLADSWLWSRSSSTVDISPLVAVTLALRASVDGGPSVYESRGVLVV